MTGVKKEWLRLMNMMKTHGYDSLDYILYQMRKIFLVLEDVWSVGSMVELQEAIDSIGTGAGTIFIEAGTYIVDTSIDIDNCGSIVIYGHGDNTILRAADGITIFNITCCASLIIKTIRLEGILYTAPSVDIPLVIVDEINDNIVSFVDVSIIGLNNFGRGIDLRSENCVVNRCVIGLLSYGILIQADYQLITGNPVISNEIGIYAGGDYCNITENTVNSNTNVGIYVNGCLYCNVSNNACIANPTGISLNMAHNNTIANNTCNTNTFDGIKVVGSNYNTFSGNNCSNNDSNTGMNTAGINISTTSDYNTISANSCNDNNNAGLGDGFGILIDAATCDENVVAANNANANDIDFQDSGTDTTIEYYVQDEFELQDAIDSIGSKSGIVNLEGSFAINGVIGINDPAVHGGSYIIRGDGSNTTLTPSGNFSCFNVREARSVVFENFAISAVNLLGTTVAIYILENSDNAIFINNITITGAGAAGYGIQIDSPNCRIENCNITSLLNGIIPTDEHCIIIGNICNSNANYGIFLNTSNYITVQSNICRLNQIGIYLTSADENLILGNTIEANTADGIYLNTSDRNTFEGNIIDGNITTNAGTDHAGITLNNGALTNFIIGNTIINNANGGAGEGYGVYIVNAACLENIVRSNSFSGNDIKWLDVGVNSDFEYKCSTNADIQDALDSIAAKTGIVEIITDITITVPININLGGDYIIEGGGDGTTLTASDGLACFNITIARSCVFRNFATDSINYDGGVGTEVIFNINEVSDNRVLIEHIHNTGAGGGGSFVYSQSDNIVIEQNIIEDIWRGIDLDPASFCRIANNTFIDGALAIQLQTGSNYNIVSNNIINSSGGAVWVNDDYNIINNNNIYDSIITIQLSNASNCSVSGNIINRCFTDGIRLVNTCNNNGIKNNILSDFTTTSGVFDYAGIYIAGTSDDNIIIGNSVLNGANTGAKDFYGLLIIINTCNNNVIIGNKLTGNDINYDDNGTGTILYADDTAYGIGWNGDLGTATRNAIYDKIQLVIAGAAANAFKTITGITNDVVADLPADTLTLAAAGGLTIVGTALTDTITFTNTITQYTDVMVEAVITAELVDGQSIDNAIDALLAASFGFKTIVPDAGADVVADAESDTLTFVAAGGLTIIGVALTDTITFTNTITQYTDGMVDARIVVQNTHPAGTIDIAIDALIAAHALVAAAHHAVYLDAHAVAAVEAAGLTMANPIAMGANNITLGIGQTVDGFDISAISITAMPTAVNNWKVFCTNGAGIMTEIATGAAATVLTGNGVNVAPSFQAAGAPAAHTHDGDTLQLDAINSDGGAFPFDTTGSITVDMVNAAATVFSIVNSGAGVASLDITGNITVSGTAIIQGLATVDGLVPEADLADSLGTAALTWLDLFVQDIKDAAGNVILSNDGAGKIDAIGNISAAVIMESTLAVQGLTTANGIVPQGDLADSLGTAALTWLNLYVQDIFDAAGNQILGTDGAGKIDAVAEIDANITMTALRTVDGVDISAWKLLVDAYSITNMPTAVNNWKMYATNGAGIMTELAVGAVGTVLTGAGAAVAPSFQAAPSGVPTHFYFVATDAEFDAAIAAITAATPMDGHIIITANLTDVQAIINAANCSFTIEGIGNDIALDANANNAIITVTDCTGLVIRNLKLDLTDHTAVGTPAIDINGGNEIRIENVFILGDNVNSIGITINGASGVEVVGCKIEDTCDGMFIDTDYNHIHENTITSCADDGIHISTNSQKNIIADNILKDIVDVAILLDAGSDNNQMSDNLYSNNGTDRTDNGVANIYGARYS